MRAVIKVFQELNVMMKVINFQQHDNLYIYIAMQIYNKHLYSTPACFSVVYTLHVSFSFYYFYFSGGDYSLGAASCKNRFLMNILTLI